MLNPDILAREDVVHLTARDDALNIRRDYWVWRSTDLFGQNMVEWRWGRIGTAGQTRRVSFDKPAEAERFVRGLIVRRRSAKNRIGVAYEPS